jgi:type III secretory pathway component EscV
MNIKQQVPSPKTTWQDETGIHIPVNRIQPSEKLREKQAYNIAKEAMAINGKLAALKAYISTVSDQVYEAVLTENDATKAGKGNFTWYNFDRSIKIEVAINERIDFDEMLIGLCKAKLDEFIDTNLNGVDTFVRELINDAFTNTKGKLDAKKVMSLLKHKSKVKDQRFQEAMKLLEDSIRRPDSKKYMRVFVKDEDNAYINIDLNFSSI